MIELARLVEDFAVAFRQADGRGPQAAESRTGRSYQPGIGPHTEDQTLRLVVDELVRLDVAYVQHSFSVPYPGAPRQRCDWCLGSPPGWDWAIEAKLLRLFGDNGKLNVDSPRQSAEVNVTTEDRPRRQRRASYGYS